MENKIRKIYSLLFCFLSLTAIQCSKDKIPPETHTGENTFGCLLDGQIFTPKRGLYSSGRDCFYQHIYQGTNGFVFLVNGSQRNGRITSIGVGFDSLALIEGKKYNLLELGRGNAYGSFRYQPIEYSNIENYSTSIANTGELVITKLDEVKQIVSGTFWFNVVKKNGDTVHITQGRFDMKYTK